MQDNIDSQTLPMRPGPLMKGPTSSSVGDEFNDSQVWCEECEAFKACKEHGPVVHIRDKAVPSFARLTTPHFFSVKEIEARPKGQSVYGVITKKVIQKRSQFGPYIGEVVSAWKGSTSNSLPLKVFRKDGSSSYLDGSNEDRCNWMMFIRPALSKEEQNLVIYQLEGQIFFMSTVSIAPGTELKAGYSSLYAAWMERSSLSQCRPDTSRTRIKAEHEKTDITELLDASGLLRIQSSPVDDEETAVNDSLPSPLLSQTQKCLQSSELVELSLDIEKDLEDSGATEQCVRGPSEGEASTVSYGGRTLRRRRRSISGPSHTKSKVETKQQRVNTVPEATPEQQTTVPVKRKRGRPRKKTAVCRLTDSKLDAAKSLSSSSPISKAVAPRKAKKSKLKCEVGNTKLYSCTDCDKAFSSPAKLQIHTYLHTGERPFTCVHCAAGFNTKYKLKRHMTIHSSDRRFQCSYCSTTFSRKDHLKNHLRVHDPDKKMYTCDRCGRSYCSSYSYRIHLTNHAVDQGELHCMVCQLDLEDKDQLIQHLKKHRGSRELKSEDDKKHICSVCGKAFFTMKELTRHTIVHTKKRDFLCQFCPQSFGRRDHLARHVNKTHASACDSHKPTSMSPGACVRRGRPKTKSSPNLIETDRQEMVQVVSCGTEQRTLDTENSYCCNKYPIHDTETKATVIGTSTTEHIVVPESTTSGTSTLDKVFINLRNTPAVSYMMESSTTYPRHFSISDGSAPVYYDTNRVLQQKVPPQAGAPVAYVETMKLLEGFPEGTAHL